MITLPFAFALRQTLAKGYRFSDLKSDLFAGFVVSLIALPLSMALAIAVGLTPEHGVYTAIVAGIVAALCGGSLFQVSGPTAAFVVILIPIVAEFGLRGLIWCQIIAGIFLILFGISKMGRLINYIPYPVTTGFTAGIAMVLATISLKGFLGLNYTETGHLFVYKASALISHLPHISIVQSLLGFFTLVLLLWCRKKIRLIPAPIIAISTSAFLGWVLTQYGYSIATIGSEFKYVMPDGTEGFGVPPYFPTLHLPTFNSGELFSWPTFAEFKAYLNPAFVIAALAALESLLSASIADSLTHTRHNPNSELSGIGIANLLSGLAAGLPATAAIARTASNIQNGAKSPFAAVFHALFILLYVTLLSSLINFIPMSALAALLLVTAYNMSHIHQAMNILKSAPKQDKIVLVTCFTLTVFIDMVAGIVAGMLLASILFIQRISSFTQIHLQSVKSAEAPKLPAHVRMLKIDGPFFFATAEKAYDRTFIINKDITILIMDMENVPYVDLSGMVALRSLLASITQDRKVYLCGKTEVINHIFHDLPSSIRKQIETSLTVHAAMDEIHRLNDTSIKLSA